MPLKLRECDSYWGKASFTFRERRREVILCLLRLNIWAAVCAETTCITLSSELQCRWSETQNASHSAPVKVHRKPGGKRFWPHRLPQTVLEHPETMEIRAPKSKRNKLKSAENRYKRAEKVFPISLGARCREFESPISDHSPLKSFDFRGLFSCSLFIAMQILLNCSVDSRCAQCYDNC